MEFVVSNTGRRFGAESATRRPMTGRNVLQGAVRLRAQSPQGRELESVGDTFTADEAEALGLALIREAAVARHLAAQQGPRERAS